MRILVDMNLTPKWVGVFQDHGVEAVHWSQVGDPTAPDHEILDWARRNHHVVFTNDLDFGRLLALTRALGPSVVQVRADDVMPGALADTVLQVLENHAKSLERGALAVIEPRIQRLRLLPL